MKKYILSLCISLFIMNSTVWSQYLILPISANLNDTTIKELLNKVPEMGVDGSEFLTELEGEFFNLLYGTDKVGGDLRGKKVGFIQGPGGSTMSSKKIYFKAVPHRWIQLYIFNNEEKAKSGGYDAVVMEASKRDVPTKEVVRRLKRYTKKQSRSCKY